MIQRLWLRNWKSHQNTYFEFSKGTNILVGPMGSGKSSVLDALCFALFGNFPALQHKRVKLSDVIMSRPVKEKEAEVKVELVWDGVRYEIERKISLDGKTEARISREGKLIQGPQPQRVNEEVERLLGVDYDVFTRVVYSEQNRIDYFLTLGRGDRKTQIDELLGISKFENMRGNLSTMLNRLKEMREDASKLLKTVDIEKIIKEGEEAERELQKINKEIAELEKKEKEIGRAREEAGEEFEKISRLEREHTKLNEKKAALIRTVEELEGEVERKTKQLGSVKIEFEETELEDLERLLGEKNELIGRYSKEFGSISERAKVVEKEVEERRELERELSGESREAIESRKNNLEKELNDAKGNLSFLKKRVSELEELISELRKEVTNCPVCESPLTEERRLELLRRREREKKEELSRIDELERRIALGSRELDEVAKKLKIFLEAEEKLKKLRDEKELEKLRSDLKEMEGKLKKEKEELKELERKRELMKTAVEVNKSKKRIQELKVEIGEIAGRIERLGFDREVMEEKRKRVEELRVEQSRFIERIEGMKKELRRVEEMVKARKEERKRYEEMEKRVKKYGEVYEKLTRLQNAVEETQKELREELIGAVNTTMESIWKVVYPYGDYKGIRLSIGESDYELQLNTDGGWVSVDGVASGGERSSASITMRIAFAMVLVPNLGWLILDEPTHNLDEEGRRALGAVLSEHAPKIVGQIFVITHDESLKDAVSGRVYHLWRDKERSEPTQVQEVNILNTTQQ